MTVVYVELTGRQIGATCSVCKKSITEKDGADHQFQNSIYCTCTKFYLNWHGAIGQGKLAAEIIHEINGSPEVQPGPSIHEICTQMEDEGFYANHTRFECKTEIRKRYDAGMVKV